RAWYACHGFD
ncbi:hypothetical protein D039_3620B, partial [Vibrio parahaemolyticus EKP-028]